MSNEDRLQDILKRQAAAAQQARERDADAEIKRQQAADLRRRVTEAWTILHEELHNHIIAINTAMGENGRRVYLHKERDDKARYVAVIIIDFNENNYGASSHLDNMRITVQENGQAYFRAGNKMQSPVTHYAKDILHCKSDDMLQAVLDFMDANTPK